ncbi:hypothetical protein WN943_020881 [Citrus x changshan-huyou]
MELRSVQSPNLSFDTRMSEEGEVLCVTGAAEDPKTDHLRELDGAKERLLLLKANLLEEGSFDSAVDGCEEVPTATGRFAVVGRVAHDYEVLKILHED